jgi:hypothetical protein
MPPSLDAAIAGGEDAIVVVDRVPGLIDVSIAHAIDSFDARRIAALAVVADGGGTAGVWDASRANWLRRFTTRDARFHPEAARMDGRR